MLAADREGYAALGLEAIGRSGAYRSTVVPDALWLVVLDQLGDGEELDRAGVLVGLHDAVLERTLGRLVPDGRYDKAMPTLSGSAGARLPFVEQIVLESVLLDLLDPAGRRRARTTAGADGG